MGVTLDTEITQAALEELAAKAGTIGCPPEGPAYCFGPHLPGAGHWFEDGEYHWRFELGRLRRDVMQVAVSVSQCTQVDPLPGVDYLADNLGTSGPWLSCSGGPYPHTGFDLTIPSHDGRTIGPLALLSRKVVTPFKIVSAGIPSEFDFALTDPPATSATTGTMEWSYGGVTARTFGYLQLALVSDWIAATVVDGVWTPDAGQLAGFGVTFTGSSPAPDSVWTNWSYWNLYNGEGGSHDDLVLGQRGNGSTENPYEMRFVRFMLAIWGELNGDDPWSVNLPFNDAWVADSGPEATEVSVQFTVTGGSADIDGSGSGYSYTGHGFWLEATFPQVGQSTVSAPAISRDDWVQLLEDPEVRVALRARRDFVNRSGDPVDLENPVALACSPLTPEETTYNGNSSCLLAWQVTGQPNRCCVRSISGVNPGAGAATTGEKVQLEAVPNRDVGGVKLQDKDRVGGEIVLGGEETGGQPGPWNGLPGYTVIDRVELHRRKGAPQTAIEVKFGCWKGPEGSRVWTEVFTATLPANATSATVDLPTQVPIFDNIIVGQDNYDKVTARLMAWDPAWSPTQDAATDVGGYEIALAVVDGRPNAVAAHYYNDIEDVITTLQPFLA